MYNKPSQQRYGRTCITVAKKKKDLIISADNKVPHSFYGLQIGEQKKRALKKAASSLQIHV